jgi:hypothetical protein
LYKDRLTEKNIHKDIFFPQMQLKSETKMDISLQK